MGLRIINDPSDANSYACFYDSVSMTAFGPVFDDSQEADDFLEWYHETRTTYAEAPDIRALMPNVLETIVKEFRDGRDS